MEDYHTLATLLKCHVKISYYLCPFTICKCRKQLMYLPKGFCHCGYGSVRQNVKLMISDRFSLKFILREVICLKTTYPRAFYKELNHCILC